MSPIRRLADSPIRHPHSCFTSTEMAFARTTALEFLRRAYEQNRLAHAYLITGPPGSGKEVLAAELASLVNGTATKDVFSSKAREIFIARPESKSRRIVTTQIRELEHALQMRAADARRKVAIIPDADRLQTEAANAFLKTLEEPPKDSLLLLLSALPEALPETILSRCIAIPLASDGETRTKKEEEKLVKLLQQASRQTNWNVQFAYRLAQEFQQLLREIREEVKQETDNALKQEQTRYNRRRLAGRTGGVLQGVDRKSLFTTARRARRNVVRLVD
jgi:DNA polymerase-3 subunit delta'